MYFNFLEGVLITTVKEIYKITSILSCGVNGTAFFVNENYALTAKHCIESNISNGENIFLYFFDEDGNVDKRSAKVVDFDDQFDIALLELDYPIEHIQTWLQICNDEISQDDTWETVGYPENWNEAEEGTKHCYIKGAVHYIDNFEGKTIFDVHLYSDLIKEDWAYTLGGLSGSPLIIKGKIHGLIIREENSAIKSQLKAVSFSKGESFLLKNQVNVSSSFYHNYPLVASRLEKQKINCKNLFQKVDLERSGDGFKIVIEPYYLKYSEKGQSKINDLAKYLAKALNQYVCDLAELKELSTDPMKLNEVYRKTKSAVYEIHKQGKLGSIILWMLLEGVLGVPKFFKRFSLKDNNDCFNELYLGIRNSKLLFYLGEGKLSNDFKESVKESIGLLESCIDIQDDIFISDEDMYKHTPPGHFKILLDKFINIDLRDWNEVILEIAIFTGYNSLQLKQIENGNYSNKIEEIVKQVYLRESESNNGFILDEIHSYTQNSDMNIIWFILPFNDISEFEQLVLKEFN